MADDRAQLLAWLSPLDPGLRHCDIQKNRINNVGEWLIGTEEFRTWWDYVVKEKAISHSCSVLEVRGSGRHLLGINDYLQERVVILY